jgi:hypothetical protein
MDLLLGFLCIFHECDLSQGAHAKDVRRLLDKNETKAKYTYLSNLWQE